MAGAKLVMPGPKMADGETLTALINREQISMSAGVPTVWLALLQYLEASGESIDSLKRVTVGGAACPLSIFKAFKEKPADFPDDAPYSPIQPEPSLPPFSPQPDRDDGVESPRPQTPPETNPSPSEVPNSPDPNTNPDPSSNPPTRCSLSIDFVIRRVCTVADSGIFCGGMGRNEKWPKSRQTDDTIPSGI